MKAHAIVTILAMGLTVFPAVHSQLYAQDESGAVQAEVQPELTAEQANQLITGEAAQEAQPSYSDGAVFVPDSPYTADEPLFVVPEPVVGEGQAVEYSLTELQQLIQSGAAAPLKESQEDPTQPKTIFSSEAELRRIFDTTPEFIYFPTGVDPMIIPWVRERVVAEELYAEALVARSVRDFEKAKAILREVNDKYPNTEHGQKAPGEIAAIDASIEAERLAAVELERSAVTENEPMFIADPPPPQRPELPQWVKDNTTAILMTQSGAAVALVGTEFLRAGDPVPRFSAVRVKTVAPSAVVYLYENEEFTVDVVGAF